MAGVSPVWWWGGAFLNATVPASLHAPESNLPGFNDLWLTFLQDSKHALEAKGQAR